MVEFATTGINQYEHSMVIIMLVMIMMFVLSTTITKTLLVVVVIGNQEYKPASFHSLFAPVIYGFVAMILIVRLAKICILLVLFDPS